MAIEDLIEAAYEAPDDSVEKACILEAAIAEADSLGDINLAYDLRMEFIDTAVWIDWHDKMLVAFCWCLNYHEKHPKPSDDWSMLWRYKWVVHNIATMFNVSAAQIIGLEDQMQQQLQKGGYNLRPAEYIRMLNRGKMGAFDEAREKYKAWQSIRRDSMADCRACEHDGKVEYLVGIQENEEALDVARKLISGRLGSCKEVPHRTYGIIMRVLLRLDLMDEAQQMHRAGIDLLSGNPQMSKHTSQHVLYLAKTRQHSRAARLIEKNLLPVFTICNQDSKASFFFASALALKSCANESNETVRLRLPETLPIYRSTNEYLPLEVGELLEREAREIAAKFDKRNGNRFYSEYLNESEALCEL